MLDCEECFGWVTDAIHPFVSAGTDLYLQLGLATACALGIYGSRLPGPLKLMLSSGAVFVIAWNSGASEASGGAVKSAQSCAVQQIGMIAPTEASGDESFFADVTHDAPAIRSNAKDRTPFHSTLEPSSPP